MDRIAKHYASVSHVNRRKWTAKDVQTALPKKRGRKPSKSKSKSKRQKKGRQIYLLFQSIKFTPFEMTV